MIKRIQYLRVILLIIFAIIVIAFVGYEQGSSSVFHQSPDSIGLQDKELTTSLELISDLGCNSCHSGLEGGISVRGKSPDLAHSGMRYNPAYLFHYLQNPRKIRHNIGRTRMPDFQFSPEESLALTRYLSAQSDVENHWPEFPDLSGGGSGSSSLERGEKLVEELACLTCHTLEGEGNLVVSDLSLVSSRLNRDWVKKYLAAPFIFTGDDSKMPSYFYQISRDSVHLEEILPDAPQKINDLVNYLFSIGENRVEEIETAYSEFADRNEGITGERGEMIFLSQNCKACHKTSSQEQLLVKNAPDLAAEGSRVKQEWLRSFLKDPQPVRPFGFIPGSGSRMPNFNLIDEEVELILSYFSNGKEDTNFENKQLSAFSMAKAEVLLMEKLSCLGCHQLGDEGGRIGPDLSSLGSRLKPSFVQQIINDPQHTVPGTIMPKISMPEKTQKLIVNYLLQQEKTSRSEGYISLIENPVILANREGNSTAKTYLFYCASCHGSEGNGKGYNSQFLGVSPTRHADPDYMSMRPDDTLFDGIFAGGYILNKSHMMPPWGSTLTNDQILDLVQYIRTLCDCTGPAWSTDNQ